MIWKSENAEYNIKRINWAQLTGHNQKMIPINILLLFLLLVGLKQLLLELKSRSWPQAEGEIISLTRFKPRTSFWLDMLMNYLVSWTRKDKKALHYKFKVNDNIYYGVDLPPNNFPVPSFAKNYIFKGRIISVSYNPVNPDSSTLHPGITARTVVYLILSAVLFAVNAGFIIAQWCCHD